MQSVVRIVFACVLLLGSPLSASFAEASASKTGQAKNNYSKLIEKHAKANGVPVSIAHAVVRAESSFNPKVTGRAGEIGLMQIKLQTARGLGYSGTAKELYDPATNLRWGMKYLGQARKLAKGNDCGMLSRYNGGHGTKRMIHGYCKRVMASS